MELLLNPKLDIVFKILFSGDIEILTDLLNAVLLPSEMRRIRSAEVRDPAIRPEEISKKFIILDILARDESDNCYDIEMQVRKYDVYPERALYYLSRLYASQLGTGERYERLRPVIGMHFLDYELFPENSDFRYRFALRDLRHPELRLTEHLSLHIVELPKPERKDFSDREEAALLEWLRFFNHVREEDDETMKANYTNPMIQKAYDRLKVLSADEETRHLAEIRDKALKDEASMLASARREGEAIGEKRGVIIGEKKGVIIGEKRGVIMGKKAAALKLLAMGVLSMEQIAAATDLTEAEVRALRENIADDA